MKLYVYKNHAGVRTWHAHLEDALESAQGDLSPAGGTITVQRARIFGEPSDPDLLADMLNWLNGLEISSYSRPWLFEPVVTMSHDGIRLADKGETLS